jgi:hypothetical protein
MEDAGIETIKEIKIDAIPWWESEWFAEWLRLARKDRGD